MKLTICLFAILGSCYWSQGYCQNFVYTNYDLNEGLPSSTVYRMTQDKDGFLWFGTDAGLSKFDGSKFTNYTTLDGLPDNEVLIVYTDSKNRVWIAPFKSSICYYQNGKIHTQKHDSTLQKIKLSSHLINIFENESGDIFFQGYRDLFCLKSNDSVVDIGPPVKSQKESIVSTGIKTNSSIWVQQGRKIYSWEGGNFKHEKTVATLAAHESYSAIHRDKFVGRDKFARFNIGFWDNPKEDFKIEYSSLMIRLDFLGDSIFAMCTTGGASLFNLNRKEKIATHLQGISVSDVLVDSEGNWWFSTISKGVYKLNSEEIKSFTIKEPLEEDIVVKSILEWNKHLLVGTHSQVIHQIDFKKQKIVQAQHVFPGAVEFHAIVKMMAVSQDRFLVGTTSDIVSLDRNLKRIKHIHRSIKDLSSQGDSIVAVATSAGVYRYNSTNLKIIDTILSSRALALHANQDDLYVGTLEGLLLIRKDRSIVKMWENFTGLSSNVSSIQKYGDSTIWVATNGNGIIAIKNNIVVAHLTQKNGLASDMCKSMIIKDDVLWLGTDKGLNKVELNKPGFPVLKYTTADGLLSNYVNCLYVNDSLVFVGSRTGFSYFDKKGIYQNSTCKFRFTGTWVNEQPLYAGTSNLHLPHSYGIVKFSFAGISFKSLGDIKFMYRLLGFDSTWYSTVESTLSYTNLSSGKYELQMYAINKFGVHSELSVKQFEVAQLITEKLWFRVLLFLVIIGSILSLLSYVISRTKRREKEKSRLNKKIFELEQLALKSQMNPHFIFNSLNSIQHFVIGKDILGANKFISGFSKLIRLTLDYSSKPLISLNDEINYLKIYLELEKDRLEDKFSYIIEVDEIVKEGDYVLPPMLIQPYIENSIRHGIRHRKDNLGVVKLLVNKLPGYIGFTIEDNGVGRKTAGLFKASNPIEYQSKGMTLTQNRVDIFNRQLSNKILVSIEDLVDTELFAKGTRIVLKIPDSL